jgi:hypothetical protein
MANSCGSAKGRATFFNRFWVLVPLVVGVFGAGLALSQVSRGDEKPAKGASKPSKKAKSAEKPDEDEPPPVDDEGLEADDDLTALVVPSTILAKAKTVDRMKFSQELRALLMEGMKADGDSLATAKRHYDAAHRAVADDPRAAYAYAISLLAHKSPKEALEQFQAAARQSPAPFLPALQGNIWVEILRNDYAKGLPAALDLARKIEAVKDAWPTDHGRQHSAEWLGRLLGYLSGPGSQSDQADAVEKAASSISGTLTGERKHAYEHGFKCIAARHQKMKELATRPVEEVLAEAKQKKQELLAEAQAAGADVKRLEDEIRDVKKPHDKQMADLNHDLRDAAARHKKAARDLEQASEEVDAYSVPQTYPQVRTMRYRVPYVTMRQENAQEKKARETQLASAKQRQQQAQATVDQTKQQMTDVKTQKEQATADFRQETADKRTELSEARKKSRQLAERVQDIEHFTLTPEKIKARVTALETYVPLDPESEKAHLLATIKPGS